MSSLVIGLDITDNQITSVLIRIEQSPDGKLSIERDTCFTRPYEINDDSDPRDIISIWVESINDVLLDFVHYYRECDNIIGIAVVIPGPMDYDSGVCYNQSSKLNKFFGLNLRLSLEHGIQDLISQWKRDYHDKYYVPSKATITKKLNILDQLRLQSPKVVTIVPPRTPCVPMQIHLPPPAFEKFHRHAVFKQRSIDFCGQSDDDYAANEKYEITPDICRSRRETYFHDFEDNTSNQLESFNLFKSNLWANIEKLVQIPMSFYNDTISFGLGEANSDCNQCYKRILALTLGSTFGSTFIDRGQVITQREDVPADGTLANCLYDRNSTANDWFSTGGLINIYKKLVRNELSDDSLGAVSTTLSNADRQENLDNSSIDEAYLARQAAYGDSNAIKAFKTFARLLGKFLIPFINAFRAELIIITGNVTEVWKLIEDEISHTVRKSSSANVYFSLSKAKTTCIGAAQQQCSATPKDFNRHTHHFLLPVTKTVNESTYDIYPSHRIPGGYIGVGYSKLNQKLCKFIDDNRMILIDGFVGTYFHEYAQELNKYHLARRKTQNCLPSLLFYDSRAFLQTDSNIQRELYLQGPNSSFGKLAFDLDFQKDFIDSQKLSFFKKNISYPCVVIGPGSSYVNQISPLIYIDLPKKELYDRIVTQTACSYLKPTRRLIVDHSQLPEINYEKKCLYFLDYPVFNKLKQTLLPRIHYFVDSQRPKCPTWIDGSTLRQALVYLGHQPVRLRPWYESSPWGGQWLKHVCKNISKHAKNYSLSFEMVPSENGLLLSDENNHLLELSWDLFYGSQAHRILGNTNHYKLFHGENNFPLRLNFLDTIMGGNLPVHCHPNLQYMREHFGEKLSQDETYYIVETASHWNNELKDHTSSSSSCIYLGFNENINADKFCRVLSESFEKKHEFNIKKYVRCKQTNVHDFFLIPNGTIHALGSNQAALVISSRPYIYSFKLYDWLRPNFDSCSHPIDLEHGRKSLDFHRYGEQLFCQPKSLKIERHKYEEQHLPTHDLHIFDVKRLIIEPDDSTEITQVTENRFHLCMLVEGDAIEVQFSSISNSQRQLKRQYNYIEAFLIPGSISEYRLRPIIKKTEKKSKKFVLLIIFLKWDCNKII